MDNYFRHGYAEPTNGGILKLSGGQSVKKVKKTGKNEKTFLIFGEKSTWKLIHNESCNTFKLKKIRSKWRQHGHNSTS